MARPDARGGLRLEGHKQRSTASPLRVVRAAETIVMPLDQHAGLPASPLVRAGERVLLGQPIAEPSGEISAWLHSSVSGTVHAIEPRPTPHHAGAPSLCIVIDNDARDEPYSTGHTEQYERLSPLELCEHIARGGIVGLGGAVFPTAAKLIGSRRDGGPRLLLNGVECEPHISCDDMLMRERAADVLFGARVLLHALQAPSCVIGIEEDMPQAAAAMRAALAKEHDERIRVATVPSLYPAGGERQLITTLFGVEVPFDGLPADVGVVCQNVGTAAAIAHWVRDGQPLVRRIVTVTGDGVQAPGNLDAPLGTPFGNLIAECGGYTDRASRLLMGGSMMGAALPHDELPVIKSTNCIVAASRIDLEPRGPEMPCIRCGDCAQVCPARLLPQQLHWYARSGDLAALETYGLIDCIECGCCDYVCPSQIPLTERFREAKPALVAVVANRDNARAARLRFEARAERLERLETERRATLARKREELRQRQTPQQGRE